MALKKLSATVPASSLGYGQCFRTLPSHIWTWPPRVQCQLRTSHMYITHMHTYNTMHHRQMCVYVRACVNISTHMSVNHTYSALRSLHAYTGRAVADVGASKGLVRAHAAHTHTLTLPYSHTRTLSYSHHHTDHTHTQPRIRKTTHTHNHRNRNSLHYDRKHLNARTANQPRSPDWSAPCPLHSFHPSDSCDSTQQTSTHHRRPFSSRCCRRPFHSPKTPAPPRSGSPTTYVRTTCEVRCCHAPIAFALPGCYPVLGETADSTLRQLKDDTAAHPQARLWRGGEVVDRNWSEHNKLSQHRTRPNYITPGQYRTSRTQMVARHDMSLASLAQREGKNVGPRYLDVGNEAVFVFVERNLAQRLHPE